MDSISEKLRNEINASKGYRHEFVVRKFTITTTLFGFGSVRQIFSESMGIGFDLTVLLFLVPIVAIAFDCYIVAEDYRIKRAGEFIRRKLDLLSEGHKSIDPHEIEWEKFCKIHPNLFYNWSAGFMTLTYLLGSSFLIWQAKEYSTWLAPWFITVIVVSLGVLIYGALLRKWLHVD